MYLKGVLKDTCEEVKEVDPIRLEYEVKKKGYNIEKFCKELGMSKSAYYRKIKGTSEFTQREIQKIVDLLDLESPMGIFFNEKVS